MVLRVADADVLPMEFGSFAETVDGYVKELHELVDSKRKQAEALTQLLDGKRSSSPRIRRVGSLHRNASLTCRT